jgi:hypothetical protein
VAKPFAKPGAFATPRLATVNRINIFERTTVAQEAGSTFDRVPG